MLTFDAELGRKLEAIYSTEDVVARRQAALEAVRPGPGQSGLDIGPGPGFLACELADRVGPTGRLATLDNNRTMLAMTQNRAHQQGLADWVELHEGDAATLPFPDGTFDFVTVVQVYEYVPDIQRALAEASRVLRPGGRLAIVDTDWDTFVLHTEDPELTARISRAWDEHLAHRLLPRRLPGLLRRAGLHLAGVKLVPVLNPAYDPNTYGAGLIGLMADFAVADVRRQSANGSFFLSLNQYLFQAIKPDAARGI
jgi:ubiquinone/menaquinone biosynthesis C-methylase UbiE